MTPEDPEPTAQRPPPSLHWTLVLLMSIVTAGIFLNVWIIVQSIWAKKVNPDSSPLALYITGLVFSGLGGALGGMRGSQSIAAVVWIVGVVLVLVAFFRVRDSLGEYISRVEGRPTYLSGVMTIFFGPIYLQYHMNKIRAFQRHSAPIHFGGAGLHPSV